MTRMLHAGIEATPRTTTIATTMGIPLGLTTGATGEGGTVFQATHPTHKRVTYQSSQKGGKKKYQIASKENLMGIAPKATPAKGIFEGELRPSSCSSL